MGTIIEDMAAQLKMPTAQLTEAQRRLRSVRLANQTGCGVGIVIGCIIGMFPLFFIDSTKVQVRKQQAHLDAIFRDVVTEAGSLVGAARVSLFVRVDVDQNKKLPTANGKFLYAKYELDESRRAQSSDRLIPLGRGIVSRAALTGEAWKIDNVQTEPDYHNFEHQGEDDAVSMLCVPVLDAQGRTIAVLQAINKIGKGRGDDSIESLSPPGPWMKGPTPPRSFTNHDVQILKALASHIGVSLQKMYEKDGQEDELRLRDTIRMLKEYGLAGLGSDDSVGSSRRRPLFPDDC
jgi:GAF domain-containing protein